MRMLSVLALFGILAFAVFASADPKTSTIKIAASGSTTAEPLFQKWIADYHKTHPDVLINYAGIGSMAGLKEVLEGKTDFGATDFVVEGHDELLQVPATAVAFAVAYNMPNQAGELRLTGAILADVYLGKIVRWNDPAITAINPDLNLPDLAVNPITRTDGSSVNLVLSTYLASQSETFKTKVGIGKQLKWPVGAPAGGCTGAAGLVKNTPGAIAVFELAYADGNDIRVAVLRNHDGHYVKASGAAVKASADAAAKDMKPGQPASLIDCPGEESYPMCGFTYLLIHCKSAGHQPGGTEPLIEFLHWTQSTEADGAAEAVKYAVMPKSIKKLSEEAMRSVK